MIGIIVYTVIILLLGVGIGLFISVGVIEKLESKIKKLEMKPKASCNKITKAQ